MAYVYHRTSDCTKDVLEQLNATGTAVAMVVSHSERRYLRGALQALREMPWVHDIRYTLVSSDGHFTELRVWFSHAVPPPTIFRAPAERELTFWRHDRDEPTVEPATQPAPTGRLASLRLFRPPEPAPDAWTCKLTAASAANRGDG